MLSSSQLNISNGGKGAVCAQIGKLGGFDLIVSIGLGPNGSGWHQAWGRAKSTLNAARSGGRDDLAGHAMGISRPRCRCG